MKLFPWIESHSLELQFWGYEIGNIVAAVTGAGGLAVFRVSLQTSAGTTNGTLAAITHLFQNFPEAAATIGVIIIVVLAFPLSRLARQLLGPIWGDGVNALAVPLALGLLVYAVANSANPFTVAACAFVVASCLLRGAGQLPLLLKFGGLALASGGVSLSLAAFAMPTATAAALGLSVVTMLSGAYVAGAGLLTYQGGSYVIASLKGVTPDTNGSLIAKLLNPAHGRIGAVLAATLDRPVNWLCQSVVHRAVFWVSAEDRQTRPFFTSMMARLPWRVLSIALAIASGTGLALSFAMANLLWAVGDIAIGSLDWKRSKRAAVPAAGLT